MASTALSTIYLGVATRLGQMQLAITNLLPIGADPGRWLLSQQLQSGGGEPQWVGHWAYLPTLPTLGFRIIAEFPQFGGAVLDGLTGNGLAASTNFTLTRPLPVLTTHGVTGLIAHVQRACRDVWFEDRLDLSAVTVAGAYTVSLSAQAAWLDSEDRVLKDAQGRPCLYDPPAQTGYPQQLKPARYGGLILDGGSPTLRLAWPYTTTGAVAQLGVIRPAYSLVNAAEDPDGPSLDADLLSADATELVDVTLLHCYRYLAVARHISDEERQRYAALVAPQEAYVRATVRHYLPRDEMPAEGKAA